MMLLLFAVLLTLGTVEAHAQTAPLPSTAVQPAQTQSAAVPSDYRVGPQDVLIITVYGEPQLSGKFRIDADGTFPFQYLGRVHADDLTLAQIETALKKGPADGYLRNPQISGGSDQYPSQNVFGMGEARPPNHSYLQGRSTPRARPTPA